MSKLHRYQGEETHGIPTTRTFSLVGDAINALTEVVVAAVSGLGQRPQPGRQSRGPQPRPDQTRRPATANAPASRGVRPVWQSLRRAGGALGHMVWVAICLIAQCTMGAARCLIYAGQHQLAGARCRSGNLAEQRFGRESLEHCANILRRRQNRLLAPATRAARRLIRSAQWAAELAVLADSMTEEEAAAWLARFATSVGVRLDAQGALRGRSRSSGAERGGAEVERADAARHPRRIPPARARVADERQPPLVEVRPARSDSPLDPPADFIIREDDELAEEDEVLRYLEEERLAHRHAPASAFAHDGD